jgi:3-hydroxybutyryl-CoA dehydrogenase
MKSIESIAVIGAGTMGQGIAQLCASNGYKVLLYDIQTGLTSKAIAAIRSNMQSAVEKGKVTASEKEATLGRIATVGHFRQLQVDLAIEAVIETLEVKQKILVELEKVNALNCLLVSNTSSLSITRLASVLKHKERFGGLHFFNPAPVMKLVEIVCGAFTSTDTIQALDSFTRSIGRSSIITRDSPGFIVNRVARLFYSEALKIVEDQVASVETVDDIMRASGFRMGPFELMDLIGVDTNLAVTTSMYNAFSHEPRFRPSRLQQQKVDAGHNGRKSGKGFYDYSNT